MVLGGTRGQSNDAADGPAGFDDRERAAAAHGDPPVLARLALLWAGRQLVSRNAIAAALARDDLAAGERLVAFSLASFADRENRARPGTPAAAGRAGLRRSRYHDACEQLVRRGLVVVDQAASGRGRASTLALTFADEGPWWEGEINAQLFEAVLGYSPAQGPARLLLAATAALADEQRVVEGLTTERLCAAAGVADRTYRRARSALLASGELILRSGRGGRGNTNSWQIPDPRSRDAGVEPVSSRRVAPPPGARPLIATVAPLPPAAVEEGGRTTGVGRDGEGRLVGGGKGREDRMIRAQNCPVVTGVSA